MKQDKHTGQSQEPVMAENHRSLTDLDVVFEGTHDAISIVNVGKDGEFYYYAVNQRYRDITGKNAEELRGSTPEQVHGSQIGRHISDHLNKCLQMKKTIQYQETLEIAGSIRSALVQLSPIMEEGKVKQILGSTRDITEQKEIEHNLEEQKKNLQVLFTNSSDGIAFFDSNHAIKDINQRFTDIFGYTLEEIAGKNLDDVISIPDVRQQAGNLTDRLMTGTPVVTEAVRFHKDGHPIQLGVKGIAVEVDGVITGGYGIYTDITREKMAQEALRVSEERWQFALEGSGNGVWDWDMETNEVFFSVQYHAILGYNKGELSGNFSNFRELVHPDDADALFEAHNRHIDGELDIVASEYRMKCRDGQWKWVLSKGKVMRWDETGKPLRMVGTITDITERKQSEDKIRYLSYHDKLTGLYNRAFFEEEMYRLDCQRNWPLTIMICDVDGLKMANDFYGHHVGDQLLQCIASVLSNACRKDDIIARWGGDEFAILLPKTSEEDALEVGERINRFCEKQKDLPIHPSISWGVAAKDNEAQSIESLIRKAELGMYKQKVKSRHSTQYQLRKRYDLPDLDSTMKGGVTMIAELVRKNRTYRRFVASERITEEQLRRWVDLARITSSGMNNQPLKYYLSWENETNNLIFPHLRWAGYLKDWDGPTESERPSAYMVVLGDTDISKNFWWDHGLAAQSILLGAVEEGYGGCMFGSIDRPALMNALELDEKFEIIMVIALGRPTEKVVLESLKPGGDIKYYRDEEQVHHVPKRELDEIILK